MSDLKLRPGDPIPARKWNGIVDRLPEQRSGKGVPFGNVSRATVRVRNNSGANRDLGEVLVLTGSIGHEENIYEASRAIAFNAVQPEWHSNISRVVVLAEPIPDAEFGDAVVSGVCLVKLSGPATGDEDFCMVDPSDTIKMKAGSSGVARFLGGLSSASSEAFFDDFHDGFFDDLFSGGSAYSAIINLRDENSYWRFEAIEDAGTEFQAKLKQLDGSDFANEVTILDPLSEFGDIVTGYVGWCRSTGNKFYADGGPCGTGA